jgi:hypothetical protein
MTDLPKYTLTEAQEAKDAIVDLIEFAFFTALSDLTDRDMEPHVGPTDGGQMTPHRGRRDLIVALVERLMYETDLVIYPATPEPSDAGSDS